MPTLMHDICSAGPVIPVIEIDDASHAKPLAHALLAGGINTMEITLRTDAALGAIRSASDVSGMTVGAGTLLNGSDAKSAKEMGASFGVSPGSTLELIDACEKEDLPFLPGIATPSEAISLVSRGFDVLKFFPAEAAGGVNMLKALSGPLKDVKFCPTGGVTRENVETYLSLPNVICTGGSWIATRAQIAQEDWATIEANARLASTFVN